MALSTMRVSSWTEKKLRSLYKFLTVILLLHSTGSTPKRRSRCRAQGFFKPCECLAGVDGGVSVWSLDALLSLPSLLQLEVDPVAVGAERDSHLGFDFPFHLVLKRSPATLSQCKSGSVLNVITR